MLMKHLVSTESDLSNNKLILNVTCKFSESNININPFRDSRIYVLLISSCCLRRQKGLQLRVEFTIYMGKRDINIPVEKSNGLCHSI